MEVGADEVEVVVLEELVEPERRGPRPDHGVFIYYIWFQKPPSTHRAKMRLLRAFTTTRNYVCVFIRVCARGEIGLQTCQYTECDADRQTERHTDRQTDKSRKKPKIKNK